MIPLVPSEHTRWSRIFSGSDFYYGTEPGPVARRAVRYARPLLTEGGKALDVGCGEGQDLAFLAHRGYDATGVDFTTSGIAKAKHLLDQQNVTARLVEADIANWEPKAEFDVVLAVNCLQFLGVHAPATLRRLQNWVAPRGVVGISLFSRHDEAAPTVEGDIYRPTLSELLDVFNGWHFFEAATLWQWNSANEAQPFVTLIASRD